MSIFIGTEDGEGYLLENLTLERAQEVSWFLSQDLNLKTFHNMDDETKHRFIRKLTLTTCFEFSPRKNWGVSKPDLEIFINYVVCSSYRRWLEDNG